MFHLQLSHRVYFAVAAAGLIAVAGCSNQPDTTASNQPPKPTPRVAAQKTATPKVEPVAAKVTQPAGHTLTVPKGTSITATMGQTLASSKNHRGDTFVASLAAPVKVHGKTVLPKGAHVTGKVVTVSKNELKVELASVVVHGKTYDLETNSLRPSDKVQPKSSKAAAGNATDKSAEKKNNSTLSAKSQLTFKLAKPVTVPVKG